MKLTFKLTSETKISITGETLYRIEATQDIPERFVTKGQKGGFVSSEKTKFGDARVSGNAWVYGDAQVSGNAVVDCVSAIIVLVIAMKYSVTVTRKYVQIGCQLFERKKALKMSKEEAKAAGLPEEYYDGYRLMVRGACRLVKRKSQT